MKKIILTVAAAASLSVSGFAQGILFEDNSGATTDTTINGVANTSQDLNLELLLGTSAGAVNVDVVTLLLSSSASPTSPALGGTYAAAGDISASGGYIYDASGEAYSLAAYAGTTVDLQVLAWAGNYSSYAAAVAAQAAVGESSVFTAAVGASPTSFPVDVSGVGTINLISSVPEPTTMALAGLGGLSLLFLRRKK
jgi:hypothetical protein